jgi:hypothetical protein
MSIRTSSAAMADTMKEKTGPPGQDGQPPLTEKVDQSIMAPALPTAETENVVMRDGIRVHPQPTADPLDPLNWSSFQKHSILAIIMLKFVTSSMYSFCRS